MTDDPIEQARARFADVSDAELTAETSRIMASLHSVDVEAAVENATTLVDWSGSVTWYPGASGTPR
jgi:hypothetical protein